MDLDEFIACLARFWSALARLLQRHCSMELEKLQIVEEPEPLGAMPNTTLELLANIIGYVCMRF